MSVLEQVIKMRNQGIPEGQIVNDLSQGGISPREINDALRQAQIKNAVSSSMEGSDELQPSIMPEEETPTPIYENHGTYQPKVYEPQQEFAIPQEEYVPQQQEQYYAPSAGYEQYAPIGMDTDTIMEISDQIFSDKIKKFQKQLDATSEAEIVLQTKIENILERLKKMETIMDKLQIAILEKVGSYGQNLEGIKKEMSMMQESFSKMISPTREIKGYTKKSREKK